MKNVTCEPLPKRVLDVREGIGIKTDVEEICSFTLERCLLTSAPGEKREREHLCPFTLEPVCMRTRALPAVRN